MNSKQTRREFLKKATMCAGAAAGSQFFSAPYIMADKAPNSKLGMAVIGCGGQGIGNHVPVAARERLVALVDVDELNIAKAVDKAKKIAPQIKTSSIKTFTDYRKMFDKMAREIDAIFIATPNHHHALPALTAMRLGKHVYVEKPMAYNVHEARTMAECARQNKVATQMGNQGHSGEGYRRLCEYIWAGAIGKVTEVYCWSNRANGGVGPRPPILPVPEKLHWDEWIGPAPFRDYHKDLHPHEWHGWHDFGNGSLGNLGCHVMDGAFWALKLEHPTSIEVELMLGGSDERFPVGTRIRWDFPARGEMPPVKIYWYDGKRDLSDHEGEEKSPDIYSVSKAVASRPPLVEELEKKYNRNFGGNGTIYVGDKGYMYTGCYGEGTRIVPEEKHQEFPIPEKIIPRIKGSHQDNFLNACRGGEPACANFDYSARFTEVILLGSLAMIAGERKKIEWDGPNMKCTNIPEINNFLKREGRKGWGI
ncbi:MAG: Gfo/Idh/MocA family oxidoreductase [Kiritimatiellae bacterium]|nr:Gfo/Idh/MocA family oxidoreductase [Kiritimatiellia bacterium]